MKFCPICEARYDEEILRFCTKDGTPLVDEDQPNFTEMPSESIEAAEPDLGEETIVRYKPPKDILPEPDPPPEIDRSEAPRIIISTSEQLKEQNVRARQIPPYQAIPPKPNTGKTVLLTILGTLAALAVVLGIFVLLRDEEPANMNVNVNTNPPDMNLNTNLNFGASNVNLSTNANYNFNTNFNFPNLNTNINANVRTPTPTPKPSPSPTDEEDSNVGNTNINGAPPATPRPTATPTPRTPTPTPNTTPRISPTLPPGSPPNNSSEQP